MVDYITAFKGHLTIQTLKDGIVLDEYKENNTIMELARVSMADIISGLNSTGRINKIVLGTEGHTGDLLTPKTYDNTRVELFSEESAGFVYNINFSNPDVSGDMGTLVEDDNGGTSTVNVSRTDTSITYTVDIPLENANNTGTVGYTEAALYVDGNIFSMKTFAGKIKDNTVQIRIIWSITF